MANTIYPGYENSKQLQYGWEDGDQWTPAECDVSIRPGWFYHETEDSKIKTNGLRIVFDSARACPCINNVSAY